MTAPRPNWLFSNLAINTAIVAFNAALIAILWIVVIAVVATQRENATRDVLERNGKLAVAYEQYALRTLDSADAIVRSLVREHARARGNLDLRRFIADNDVGKELMFGIAIADERGDATLAVSSTGGERRSSIADREHFRGHLERDDGRTHVDKPVSERLSGRPVVPISRRITKGDGTFGGIAVVWVEPSRLTDVLGDELAPLDFLSLVGLDGVMRARRLGSSVTSGENVSGGPLLTKALPHAPSGSFLAPTHTDGVLRFASYRKLPGYDLVVSVGVTEAGAMAGYYQDRTRYLWAAGLGSAFIASFAFLLMLAVAGRTRANEALRQQHALLANAQRVAGMGIWERDLATNRLTWSPETYRIFGVDATTFAGTFEAFLALVHPQDVQRLRFLLTSSAPDGSEVEYRIVRPGGEERVLINRGETTRDAGGRPVRKLGVVMDVTESRKTESALREAENKYRSIFESSHDGIFQTSPEGRFLTANPAMARILGFDSAEELIRARTDIERQGYVEPALREEFRRQLEERGFITGFEYEVRRKDGSTTWVSENARVVRDAAGRPVRYEGTFQDISERRRAGRALLASATEFRNLAESMPQMVWVARPDGRNIYISQQWSAYTGMTIEDALGGGWSHPFHPEDRQRSFDAWHLALSTAGKYSIECRLRRADGVYRWWLVRAAPQFDAAGAVVKWFGTCTDIHDLKRAGLEVSEANRELQRKRAELRVLFDLIPAMIWFKDTENNILRVNQRVAQAAGRPIEEIEGKPTHEVYPREAAAFHAADLEVIRSGLPLVGFVERLDDPDGGERWVETDKVPYRDESGKVIGIVVMAQDVTERQRAAEDLDKIQLELREVSRKSGMSEVATNVLHNIGNILNSVNVSGSLMVESLRGSRAPRLAEVVATMQGHKGDLGAFLSTDSKGRHIPDVLETLSQRWLAEQATLELELVSLRENIEHIKQIVALQQGYAKVSGAADRVEVSRLVEDSLRVEAGGSSGHHVQVFRDLQEMPAILVERHRAMQILVNLMRNAKLACDERAATGGCITLSTSIVDSRVRISVSDNGCGIAPENLTRVFAHGFTTRKDGHGFGLHSGALTAAELGGSLSAHSDGPGKGATFILDLPVQPPGERA